MAPPHVSTDIGLIYPTWILHAVARIVCTLCLMADDPQVVEPVVLRDDVIDEMGGGLRHVPAIAGRAYPAPLARERDDKPLAAARAESTAEVRSRGCRTRDSPPGRMQGGPCPDPFCEGGKTPADRHFCRFIFSTSRMFAAAARVMRDPARVSFRGLG